MWWLGLRSFPGFLLIVAGLIVQAQEPGFHLEGMSSRLVPVTVRKMTNLIFPVDVAAGVRVSRDVLVQKVKGVENVVELKALTRDFAPTNLSVYGDDGRLYSFVLHYVEDTTVLDYRVVGDSALGVVRLSGWPVSPEQLRADARRLVVSGGFLHRRVAGDGLGVTLTGVYAQDSLLWLILDLRDKTPMGIRRVSLRLYTQEKKTVKRTASQELEISPVYSEGVGALAGLGRSAVAVAIRPLFLRRGRRLVVVIADAAGDRQVVLRVKGKVLAGARKG